MSVGYARSVRHSLYRAGSLLALSCPVIGLGIACSSFQDEPPAEATSEAGPEGGDAGVPVDEGGGSDVVAIDAGPIVCPSSACVVLAPTEANAREIAADADRVYWTVATSGSGAVRSVPIVGGSVRTVSGPEDQPKSFQLFNDSVYYATGSAAHQVKKNGTTDAGAKLAAASGGGEVSSVARHGGSLFFTFEYLLARCAVANVPCNGSSATFSVGEGARALAPAPDAPPYLAHANAIWQADDVTPPQLRFQVANVRTLLVDDKRVYFLRTGVAAVESLLRSDSPTTTPTRLATASAEPRAMAIDSTDLFFTTLEDGTVTRVSKFGPSAPVVVVKGLVAPQGVAVSADRIFVVDESRIVSIPKPPKGI